MRYLGIDYGSRRVGLALSDEAGTMGFPHAIVANSRTLVDHLCRLMTEKKIGAVVIGESRTLEGAENPIATEARALARALGERAGVPVFFESEVFTSEAARAPHTKRSTAKTRKLRTRRPVDDSAAALILTSYLSRIAHD